MRMARALNQQLGVSAEVLLQETGAIHSMIHWKDPSGRGFRLKEMARREWVEDELTMGLTRTTRKSW